MDMDSKNTSDHVPVIAQIKRKLVRRAQGRIQGEAHQARAPLK
jgi:hypothetical protein